MPVNRLLVEGRKLDAVLLGAICQGNPVVTGGSPKGSLGPQARDLRRETKTTVFYVRDRDFDFLPPADLSQPVMDKMDAGLPLGWRWCRHEMENYLIDPAIIHAALGWDKATFEAQLISAARSIKYYQAARWTVGQSRRILPQSRTLPTKPGECIGHEFRLPADVTEAATATWVQSQAATFLANVQTVLDTPTLAASLAHHSSRLTDAFLGDLTNVLVWCSGKDLLSAMITLLQATHRLHPSQLRIRVRDWIQANPDPALALLPEWDAFRNLMRA